MKEGALTFWPQLYKYLIKSDEPNYNPKILLPTLTFPSKTIPTVQRIIIHATRLLGLNVLNNIYLISCKELMKESKKL